MKQVVANVLIFVLVLACVFGLSWVITGNSLALYTYFAPKQEAARRQVFEETKSYNQAMVQELQNMQFEYVQATPEQQKTLRGIILHRAADYPTDRLPPDLRNFIEELK